MLRRIPAKRRTPSLHSFVEKDHVPFPKSKKQEPTEQEALQVLFGCHQMSVISRTISNSAWVVSRLLSSVQSSRMASSACFSGATSRCESL